MLFLGVIISTNLFAECSLQRPNRRARKQYTSPEEIKAQQDSLLADTT